MHRVAVGGTFDILHAGHKKLLETAFFRAEGGIVMIGLTSDGFSKKIGGEEANEAIVLIGLTSDEFANKRRGRKVRPYSEREEALKDFLRRFSAPYDIIRIDNRFGFALETEFDALVVSEATAATGEEINRLRRETGRKEVRIITVPHVLADDSIPVSSTRVLDGEIDENGHLTGKMVVAAGSGNPVKVSAIRSVFERAFPDTEIEIIENPVESGVSDQPFEDETITGAINRAKNAINGTNAHYGVGVEAGLFFDSVNGKYMDVQYCAIIDRAGEITIGHGAGFSYPDEVISLVLNGREDGITIGDAMKTVYGKEDIGKKEGAVGFLSRGLLNRKELTEHAVIAALIPRISRMA